MAARKKTTSRKPRAERGSKPLWDRLLSGGKVRQTLLKIGADPDAFAKSYEAGGFLRSSRALESYEIEAVEEFQRRGDLQALMRALQTENRMIALAAVGRYAQQQARG